MISSPRRLRLPSVRIGFPEQYNILLEDQSYLFQEKAIQLHEANIKHIADGIYDDWIKDSLKALAILYPMRYAKTEESEIFFDDNL